MKYQDLNITLIADRAMNMATISQNGRQPAFIDEQHLEELRNLLNEYLDQTYGEKSQTSYSNPISQYPCEAQKGV